tara:strand:- start:236 stop:505 length:270 start_codon:yes stop_codon:yes gene_type:complete
MFLGLKWDLTWLIENFNSEYIFINLKPELVEKKDPPIIISIKKTKEYLSVVLSNEKPILETLLDIDKKSSLKLIVLSEKTKKNKYIEIK